MLSLTRKRPAINGQRLAVTTHDSRLTTHDSRSQRGFSLLEIVIALAIVTIGIVGVMIIFPAGLRASQRAADFTTAATLGSGCLQYIAGRGYDALPGLLPVYRRDFDDHPNWQWSGSFVQEATNLRRVTVSIYWTDRGEERERFVTFMAP